MFSALHIHFDPLVPVIWLAFWACLMCGLLGFLYWRTRCSVLLRSLTALFFVFALSQPMLRQETRIPQTSIATIIVDQSQSQNFGHRKERTQKALDTLQTALKSMGSLETRVAYGPENGALASQTDLFHTWETLTRDIPEHRRAATFFITDGQIHDLPSLDSLPAQTEPLHVLLTGEKKEPDRRITLLSLPRFGLIGKPATVTYKIEDSLAGQIGGKSAKPVRVTLEQAGEPLEDFFVTTGETQTLSLPVAQAGQNIFTLSVAPLERELTLQNNQVILDVQGVRDQLKVLLVSGKPHAGARVWRDLLTSDPAVDLVHFTILREPDKIDSIPTNQLSLIAFPFEELFETKLYDFDLIIFDSYRMNNVLPDHYFENIVRYVKNGGAFLEVSGPDFAGPHSVARSPLGAILPGRPAGPVYNGVTRPVLTPQGTTHPVTQNLQPPESAPWGPWLRTIPLQKIHGETLMTAGEHADPLLILDRIEKGRVAQIASDQIWLWAKGYQGGGPHAELLRRIIHWLMKEPELDERALRVQVDGVRITLRKSRFENTAFDLTVTRPDGTTVPLALAPDPNGFLTAHLQADQQGIYRFQSPEGETRFAVIGETQSLESRHIQSTEEIMAPFAKATDGGIFWLSEHFPALRRTGETGLAHGAHWAGLRDLHPSTLAGITEIPLLPFWLTSLLLGIAGLLCWWKEGR